MIVFNDTLGAYGGSHTLMLRMCRWLREHHIKAAVLCTSDANEEIAGKIRALDIPVICMDIKDVEKTARTLRSLQEEEPITVISFMWPYYLDMELIKRKAGLRFANIVYAIHPDTFKKGLRFENTVLHDLIAGSYGKILERMNRNKALYFMDEDVLKATRAFMKVSLDPHNPLLHLPMFCPERKDAEEIIQNGFASPVIMTAARAEYPYKGYLLGLVDTFKTLKVKYPALQLEIVTGGMEEDVARLREKQSSLPEEFQKDIIFHNWMDYDTLRQEMERCKVFIGMGTSVLDAALVYKPAIAVKYNTFRVLADGFLSSRPACIAADPNCQTAAAVFLEQALLMNEEEYRAACLESFRQVKGYYDIDQTMRQLLEIKTEDDGCVMTSFEAARHYLNNRINRLLHRGEDRFNVQSIKKE